MNLESILFVLAPLFVFILGVLFIPVLVKPKINKSNNTFKAIEDLEKKYIY